MAVSVGGGGLTVNEMGLLVPSDVVTVMLPAPKRFEKKPDSAYVLGRAGTVMARMGAVELP